MHAIDSFVAVDQSTVCCYDVRAMDVNNMIVLVDDGDGFDDRNKY